MSSASASGSAPWADPRSTLFGHLSGSLEPRSAEGESKENLGMKTLYTAEALATDCRAEWKQAE